MNTRGEIKICTGSKTYSHDIYLTETDLVRKLEKNRYIKIENIVKSPVYRRYIYNRYTL